MHIVEAKASDARQIHEYLKELYAAVGVKDAVSLKEILAEFKRPRKYRPYYLLAKEKTTVGMMRMSRIDGTYLINTLIVAKEHRKKGIGRKFIKFAEKQAKTQKIRKLWAYSAVDFNAKGFYEKNGFIQEGCLKKHFFGKDHYIFGKILS